MLITRRSLGALAVGAISAGSLAACSKDSGKAGGGDTIKVFASTIVWGSVAKNVGGDKIDVFSAVSTPDQDPHDYEASADDKLKLSTSKVALINGGGYDTWADRLVESVKTKPAVVDAFKLSGIKEGENEHVFYSLDTAVRVAHDVAARLKEVDSANGATYEANAKTFADKIEALKNRAKDWGAKNGGGKVVSTESVAQYLVEDLGLTDITPEEYVRQSESEAGPSVATVEKTRLLVGTQAKVLLVNGQTEDAVSKKLVARAEETKARIVKVYETFPEGVNDYVDFMTKAVDSITG